MEGKNKFLELEGTASAPGRDDGQPALGQNGRYGLIQTAFLQSSDSVLHG
jgi:hypothetical protein